MNPDELLKQGNAMLAQTKAEGNKPFAGSSYDPATTTPIQDITGLTSGITPVTGGNPANYYKAIDGNYYDSATGKIVPGYADTQLDTDPMSIRQNYISAFQDRINAINQIYSQQLAKAQQESKGRVGSGTAILAARGMTGSRMGEAQKENILGMNRDIESAIQAEQASKIAEIMGEATNLATAEAQSRRQAKEQGVKTYLEYLKGQEETKLNNASQVAQLLLNRGVDINTMSPEELNQIAKQLGVSTATLNTAYQSALKAKQEGDVKQLKTQAEIDKLNMEIQAGKWQSIGDGSILMNTITGEKVENPKSSVGGGGLSTTQLFDRELKLADNFQEYAKDANIAIRQISVVNTGFDEANNALKEGKPLNAQSQAVIVGFNKIIDPTSVVRESEYARTPEGASLLNKLDGKIIQIKQGGAGLNKAELEAIKNLSNALLEGYRQQQLQYANLVANQAQSIGADLGRILPPDVLSSYNTSQSNVQSNEGSTKVYQGVTYKVINGVWTPQ